MSQTFKQKIQSILDDEDRLQEVSDKSFKKYDVDGSGYIEFKEYRKIIAELYNKLGQKTPKKAEIDEMIEDLDRDGDHKLDSDEFKEHTRSVLYSMINGTLGF